MAGSDKLLLRTIRLLKAMEIQSLYNIGAVFFIMTATAGCQSLNFDSTMDSNPKEQVTKIDPKQDETSNNVDESLLLHALATESGLSFSQEDEFLSQKALENNFTNQTTEWIDEVNKAKLSITPTRTFELEDTIYCRDYKTILIQAVREVTTKAIACRQPNGVWLPR